MENIVLTTEGKMRIAILYEWLRKNHLLRRFTKNIKANTSPNTGFDELYKAANDSFNSMFNYGFQWADTPEGWNYWQAKCVKFELYAEGIEYWIRVGIQHHREYCNTNT